jgi:large subunit ribosomal protein L35
MGKKKKKYKLKTYKAAAKRFKITKNGKVLRTKGGSSHLRRKKSSRVKRQFGKMIEVKNSGDKRRIKRLAPYLKKYG